MSKHDRLSLAFIFIYASTEVRLASLYVLLCCFAAWLMRRGGLRPGFLAGSGTGAVVALCYLARPEAILFLPLAAVLPFLRGRKRESPGPRPAAPSTNHSAASQARGSDIPVAIQADPDRGRNAPPTRANSRPSLWERHSCRDPDQPTDQGRNAPPPAAGRERSRSGAARISYLAGIALGFALLSSPYWVFLLEDCPPPPELERVRAIELDGRRIVLYRFKTVSGKPPGNGFEKRPADRI